MKKLKTQKYKYSHVQSLEELIVKIYTPQTAINISNENAIKKKKMTIFIEPEEKS